MANVFKPKRSSTASSVPTTSDLADGELAVNSADQKIYLRDGASIIEVGNASSASASTTRTVNRYVATANQTLFPSSGTITYTVGYVDVFLNGTKLDSTEFTASNGTTVTLTTGATVDDIVELIAFSNVAISGGGNFNELDATLFS